MPTNRKTPYTDSNGRLKPEFRESFEIQHLDAARKAGIPRHWLAVNGSDGPAGSVEWEEVGDLTGGWSGLLYELSAALRGVDRRGESDRHNLPHVETCLAFMARLAQAKGIDVDTPGLIPWDVWAFRVQMYESHGWEFPDNFSDVVVEVAGSDRAQAEADWDAMAAEWNVPNTEDHWGHGHGKHLHGWTCLKETA